MLCLQGHGSELLCPWRALRALGPPFLVPPSFLLLFLPAFFRFHKVAFADRIGSGTKKKWGVSPAAAPAWFGFLFLLSLPIPSAVSPCPFASASRDLAWHFCFCFFSWLLSLLRSASNFLILSQTPPTADPSQRPSFQFPIFLFFHMPQLEISNSFFWCSFSFQLASCPQRTQACAGDSGVQVIVAGTRSSSLISSLDAPPIDAAITGCLRHLVLPPLQHQVLCIARPAASRFRPGAWRGR